MNNNIEQMVLPGIGMTLSQQAEVFEKKAILLLREYEPGDGYHLAFSGGKDSVVIKYLAIKAKVNFRAVYNVTTIDPPELVYFIKDEHHDVTFRHSPHGNFFHCMAENKGFPTRRQRWCCDVYKHYSADGTKILGVRAAESAARAKRWQLVTNWTGKGGGLCVNPIVYWSDELLWYYIRNESINYCCLYDEGFCRLGCVGCPMAGQKRWKEFARWPRYEMLWRLAFKRLWERKAGTKDRYGREWMGSALFANWEALFDWWMSDSPLPKKDVLFDYASSEETDVWDNTPTDEDCQGLD